MRTYQTFNIVSTSTMMNMTRITHHILLINFLNRFTQIKEHLLLTRISINKIINRVTIRERHQKISSQTLVSYQHLLKSFFRSLQAQIRSQASQISSRAMRIKSSFRIDHIMIRIVDHFRRIQHTIIET